MDSDHECRSIRRIMKALIKEEPKKGYVLKEMPIPKPKADEVLYKVEKVRKSRHQIQ